MSTYLNSIFYNKPNADKPGILDRMRRYFFTTDTKAAMLETIVETRESIEEVVSEPVVDSIETKSSLEIKYEDTRKTLESLQKGHEAFFNFSLYIGIKPLPIINIFWKCKCF